ncbi:hypothetical protein ACHWQZ_G013434 [Mnemiopsis leidyi]
MVRDSFDGIEIFYIVYFLLILVVGLICHVLILLAFALNPSVRRSVSNLIFASIAVADSCTICWTVPVSLVSRFKGDWPWELNAKKEGPICDFSGVVDNSVAVCSMWTLGFYALDRLIYVMYPLKYHTKMTRRKAVFVLFCIWIYSTSLSLPPVFEFSVYRFSSSTYTCGIGSTQGGYLALFFIGAFPIPLITICVSYIIIYIIARENSRRVSSLCESLYDGSENLMNKAKTHIKSTAVVSAVIVSSLICILPIFVTGLYLYIAKPTAEERDSNQTLFSVVNQIGTVLFFLNCNAGTIIFISCNKQLRKAIHNILKCETSRSSTIKKLHQSTIRPENQRTSTMRSPLTGVSNSKSTLSALPYISASATC